MYGWTCTKTWTLTSTMGVEPTRMESHSQDGSWRRRAPTGVVAPTATTIVMVVVVVVASELSAARVAVSRNGAVEWSGVEVLHPMKMMTMTAMVVLSAKAGEMCKVVTGTVDITRADAVGTGDEKARLFVS